MKLFAADSRQVHGLYLDMNGKQGASGLYLDINGKEGASGPHSLGQPLAVVAIATGGIHNCVPWAHKACPDCLQA